MRSSSPPERPTKGRPFYVLVAAGRLAHQHQRGFGVAVGKDQVLGGGLEVAAVEGRHRSRNSSSVAAGRRAGGQAPPAPRRTAAVVGRTAAGRSRAMLRAQPGQAAAARLGEAVHRARPSASSHAGLGVEASRARSSVCFVGGDHGRTIFAVPPFASYRRTECAGPARCRRSSAACSPSPGTRIGRLQRIDLAVLEQQPVVGLELAAEGGEIRGRRYAPLSSSAGRRKPSPNVWAGPVSPGARTRTPTRAGRCRSSQDRIYGCR